MLGCDIIYDRHSSPIKYLEEIYKSAKYDDDFISLEKYDVVIIAGSLGSKIVPFCGGGYYEETNQWYEYTRHDELIMSNFLERNKFNEYPTVYPPTNKYVKGKAELYYFCT